MPPFPGTPGDDILYGTEDADLIEGFGGNDHLFGFGGDDTIDGGDGSDIIYGGTGADTLTGGLGNDYYEVNDIGELVIEAAGAAAGTDLVFTTIDYTLPDNVERLAAFDAASTTALTLTGNTLNNEIIGNAGANLLIGGGGTDLLRGDAGDDSYVVDSSDDVVGEIAGGGYDIVYFNGTTSNALHAGFEYTLMRMAGGAIPLASQAVAVEQLSVYDPSSTNSVNLRGSLQNDVLTGNDGINILEGYSGNDTMIGYGGDDHYFVGQAGDVVVEQAGGGYDTVFIGGYYLSDSSGGTPSITSYTLGDHLERLILSPMQYTTRESATVYTLTGNALDNEITGANNLNTLDGKEGRDVLMGRSGADTFAFTTALGDTNVDQILDFQPDIDKIALDDAVFAGLTPGALPTSSFRQWHEALDEDDHILYDPATGNLWFDADGSGSAAAQLFAVLHEGLSLESTDFIVI